MRAVPGTVDTTLSVNVFDVENTLTGSTVAVTVSVYVPAAVYVVNAHDDGNRPPADVAVKYAAPALSSVMVYFTSIVTAEPPVTGVLIRPAPEGLVPIAQPARMRVIASLVN